MNWKLLIVDDHEVVRVSLSALLDAADITVVGTAGDAEEALEKATSLQPDLARILHPLMVDDHFCGC